MVSFNSAAGKMLVSVSSGTTAPATEYASEAARLFLVDVTQTLRWHATLAGVALAATPIVYQLSRIVAQCYRAELVNVAKDAVQREELFNGTEADGVLIDPADEGGITVSYNTLSSANGRRTSEHAGATREGEAEAEERSSEGEGTTLAMRLSRRHAWAVSSLAHQVLAVQRAPKAQFVRTCSRAAAWQYGVVVLRVCARSCVLCVASYSVMHACCTALDHVVPLTSDGGEVTRGTSLTDAVRHLVSGPLFDTAAPPSPLVGSSYGLYDFSMSAAGVFSRLIPKFGGVQTLCQRLFGHGFPLHMEWREGGGNGAFSSSSSSSSLPHARADAVWAALSPRGYFIAALLPRLSVRVFESLQWASNKASNAVLRRRYNASATPADSSATPPPAADPTHPRTAAPLQRHVSADAMPAKSSSSTAQQQQQQQQLRKLIHTPLVWAAVKCASDVAYPGVVFAAAWWASSGGGNGGPRSLVRNAAGPRYNAYCWVQAVAWTLDVIVH